MATARDKITPSRTTLPKISFFGAVAFRRLQWISLTNVNFKNLSEHLGFRGHQDHYNAYVQDFGLVWIQIGGRGGGGEMAKCARFSENSTKTRTSGLTAKLRGHTDGGSRDPVRPFEEFLRRRPSEMRTSGCL